MPPEKKGRKSSILKPPKVRNPLSDLDFKPSSEDDGITSEFTRSRRVSFSSKKGVALFTSDEGNTVWHNIYEEANKPDVSDSSSIAASNQTNASAAAQVYSEIQLHENVSPDESTSFDGAGNHDITFAALAHDDDDSCDTVGDMLKNLDKLAADNKNSEVFEMSQPTYMDQTDALINYEINFESIAAKFNPSRTASTGAVKSDRSILFDKNDAGKSSLFSNNTSKALIDKENIDRQSLHCLMENDIQNRGTALPRKRFASSFDQYQQDCINLNKVKVPSVARSSNLNDITDICESSSVSEPVNKDKSSAANLSIISIIEESKRVHKIKQTIGGCPLASFEASFTAPIVYISESDNKKRQTIVFDQKDSEGDMSITSVIPPVSNKIDNKRKTIVFNQEMPDCNMSMTGMIPPVMDKADQKRRTILFDKETPDCNMTMTAVIPPIVYKVNEKGATIGYNQEMHDCDISMTSVIPSIVDKVDDKRKTIVYNQETPDCNMSMTSVIPPITDKRKTIVYNQETPDCNMSMTSVIPPITNKSNEKRKTIEYNQDTPDCNMSMTSVIPPIKEKTNEKRKTILYNQEMPDCNMSMTSVIPPITNKSNEKRKTILYNQDTPDCNMSMTSVIPPITNKSNEKRKTILYNQDTPDCNMSMTSVIPPIKEKTNEKRKTILYNQEMPYCNMSMTSVIPPIKEKTNEKRKTILYNQEMPDCNMSMTSVIPPITNKSNEKRKTILYNQDTPDCNMSMTSVIPPITNKSNEKRKTILYNQDTPDCNMSMTSVIPPIKEKTNEKRKTILYNQEMPYCNMSMTSVIPPIKEKTNEKRKTILYNQEMPDCNMSMTSVIPQITDKRKTNVYNQETPDCNMSMTRVIPPIIDKFMEKRKTIVYNQEMPDCNMSMTGMIPPALLETDQRRKTILFTEEMPDNNMSMTSVIPPTTDKVDEKRKTIIFNESMPDCNMSMTGMIPPLVNKSKSQRKTIIFDQEMADCNMSIASIISPIADSKTPERKTIAFNQAARDFNMSMANIISPIVEQLDSKRKTIVFNQEMPDCNMSITCAIPPLLDNIDQRRKTVLSNEETPGLNVTSRIPPIIDKTNEKRKTILLSQEMPNCNMSMSGIIPHVSKIDQKSKKKLLNQEITDFNMSGKIPQIVDKVDEKRKTIIFDQKMPNCDMSMTSIILPVNNKSNPKRKTILFDQKMPNCNMSLTEIIPPLKNIIEPKRKTIVFNQEMPDSNMSMTTIIPPVFNKSNPKRKTILFDQEMPNCNMSLTEIIPPLKNKIVFNHEMPDSNMSMTAVIPHVMNKNDANRNTVAVNQETQDGNIPIIGTTNPGVDEIDQKRKTIELSHTIRNVISPIINRVDGKRKTRVFNHEMPDSNMSMTSIIPPVVDKTVTKRQTVLFNQDISDGNMLICATIPPVEDTISNAKTTRTNPLSTETEQDRKTHEPLYKSITDLPDSPVIDHSAVKSNYELHHYDTSQMSAHAKKKYEPLARNVSLQCENIENELAPNDNISNISKSIHFGKAINSDNATLSIDGNPIDVFENGCKSIKYPNVSLVDTTLKIERSTTTKISEDFHEATDANHKSRRYSAMGIDMNPLIAVDENNETSKSIRNLEPLLFDNLDLSLPEESRAQFTDRSVAKLGVSIYQSSNEECTNVLMMESSRVLKMHNQSVREYSDEKFTYNSIRKSERLIIDNFDSSDLEEPQGQFAQTEKSVAKLGVSIYQTSNEECTKVLMLESNRVLKMSNHSDEKLSKSMVNSQTLLVDDLNLYNTDKPPEQLVDSDKSVGKLAVSLYQTSNDECQNVLMIESSRLMKNMQDQSVMNLTDGKLSKSLKNPEPLLFDNLEVSHCEGNVGQLVSTDKSILDLPERHSNLEKLQCKTIDLKINDNNEISRMSSNDDKEEDIINMSIDMYHHDEISNVGTSLLSDELKKESVKSCTVNENLNSPSTIENLHEKIANKSSYAVGVSCSGLNSSNSAKQQSLYTTVNKSQTFNRSQKNHSIFNKSDVKPLTMNESAFGCKSEGSVEKNKLSENLNVLDAVEIHRHSNQNKTIIDDFDQSIDTKLLVDNMDSKYDCTMEDKQLTDIDDIQTSSNNCEMNFVQSVAPIPFVEMSDASDRIEDKSVDIYEILNETREKRKSDNGDGYESSINKKMKASMPVCTWLSDLKNESQVELSVCNKDTNISAKNINATHKDSIYNGTVYDIDTTTYVVGKTNVTLSLECFDKPQMDVSTGKPNLTLHDLSMNISDNKNIKCDSIDFSIEDSHKSTDDYLENISDLTLVNISMDKSDDNHHEEIENNEDLKNNCADSLKLSVSGKSLNLSGSICHSMHTMLDPDDSRNASIVMPFEPPPNLVGIIDQIGLDMEDCVPENLDGNEWTFRLLRSAIRLIVKFGPSVPENKNLERLVLSIALELIAKAKPSNVTQMFHPHAAKVMLHQLKSEELTSLCQISGDLPNLLRHCAQVSSAAREWSSDLYSLYVNYGLQYLDDRFSFRIANGLAGCIWQVDIKTHLLPFANSENIIVRVLHGSSPIQETAFKSAANKIRPNWVYLKNLAFGLHRIVKEFCDTL